MQTWQYWLLHSAFAYVVCGALTAQCLRVCFNECVLFRMNAVIHIFGNEHISCTFYEKKIKILQLGKALPVNQVLQQVQVYNPYETD